MTTTNYCPTCQQPIPQDNNLLSACGHQTGDGHVTAHKNLDIFGYFLKCLKNPDFNGRAPRKEYWSFSLFAFIAEFILILIVGAILAVHLRTFNWAFTSASNFFNFYYGPWPILYKFAILLFSMPFIVSHFAVFIRRMHDTGRSGWRILWLAPASLGLIAGGSWGWGNPLVYLLLYGTWFIISIYLLFLLCIDGDGKENEYGLSIKG
jgi:uncharacterized membrane protein YhaH (DUF805 family)